MVSQNEVGEIKIIHSFETNNDKEWEIIDFEYYLEPRTKYRFVVKSQGKERFSKEVYNSEGQNDFVVFPKMAEDFITVEFKKAIEHSTYKIVDSKGIVHSTGEVLDMSTQIEIGDLLAGSYFIRLDKYPKDAENFTKL